MIKSKNKITYDGIEGFSKYINQREFIHLNISLEQNLFKDEGAIKFLDSL